MTYDEFHHWSRGAFFGSAAMMLGLGICLAIYFKSCQPEPVRTIKKTEQQPTLQHVERDSAKVPNPAPLPPVTITEYVPVYDTVRIHDTVPYFRVPAMIARLDSITPNGDTVRVKFAIPEMVFRDLYFNRPDSILKVTERQYYQTLIERVPLLNTYAFFETDYNIGGKLAPSVGLGSAFTPDHHITIKAEARGAVTDGVLRPFLNLGMQYNF